MPESAASSPATAPKHRSPFIITLHVLPVMIFISMMLWCFVGAAIFSLNILINLETIGLVIVLVILVPPALWANYKAIRLAYEGERDHPF